MKRDTKEYLFVDGYNIINAWNNLRTLSEGSLEAARNELIDIMAEYSFYTGIKVIIVFDAHLVKGSIQKKEAFKGVEVVYTREKESADHYIERKLDDIGRTKKVRVATSDWLEQQVVFGRGGTRISARELKVEVEECKKMIRNKASKVKTKNNIFIGGLDEEQIKKLEKFRKKE